MGDTKSTYDDFNLSDLVYPSGHEKAGNRFDSKEDFYLWADSIGEKIALAMQGGSKIGDVLSTQEAWLFAYASHARDGGGLKGGVMELFNDNPEFLEQMAREGKSKALSGAIGAGVSSAVTGIDIINSINQIRRGEKDLDDIRKRQPTKPEFKTYPGVQEAVRKTTEELDRSSMLRSVSSMPAAARAAIKQNMDSLNINLDTARSMAGGQAGIQSALSQQAIDRYRQSPEVSKAIQADRLMREQLSDADMQAYQSAQGRAMFQNMSENKFNKELYPYDLDTYNKELLGAGQGAASGRVNLSQSLHDFAGAIPSTADAFNNRQLYFPGGSKEEQSLIDDANNQSQQNFNNPMTQRGFMNLYHPNWNQEFMGNQPQTPFR